MDIGKDVEIVLRSNEQVKKTYDLLVDGVKTEIKTLNSTSLNTSVTRIQEGFDQGASTVIVDERKTGFTLDNAQTTYDRINGVYKGNVPGDVEIWTNERIVRH